MTFFLFVHRRKVLEDPYMTGASDQNVSKHKDSGNPLQAALFMVAGYSGHILVYENL